MGSSENTSQPMRLVSLHDNNGTEIEFEIVTNSKTANLPELKRTRTPQLPLSSHPCTKGRRSEPFTYSSPQARPQAGSSDGSVTIRSTDTLNKEAVKRGDSSKYHSDMTRDFINGFAEGATVPLALTAGLSSIADRKSMIAAGLLAVLGGAISMGAGVGLNLYHQRQEFLARQERESERILAEPEDAIEDVAEVFRGFGIEEEDLRPLLRALVNKPRSFKRFLMEFQYRIHKPSLGQVITSAVIRAVAYVMAGALSMIPYFITVLETGDALLMSIGIAIVELLALGLYSGYVAGLSKKAGLTSALIALVVRGFAVGACYALGVLVHGA